MSTAAVQVHNKYRPPNVQETRNSAANERIPQTLPDGRIHRRIPPVAAEAYLRIDTRFK